MVASAIRLTYGLPTNSLYFRTWLKVMWNGLRRTFFPGNGTPKQVNVVLLQGMIAGPRNPRALSHASVERHINNAFKSWHPPDAVALVVNSPGGSPVQSSLIADHIRTLAEKNKIPVVSFAEDVAASGGYWLLAAADEIYADKTSIVGSIGVVAASFDLSAAIHKVGVERRLITAGEHKARLDPFLPTRPEDVQRMKEVMQEVHEVFKEQVRQRRGDKIKGKEEQIFKGDFFTGQQAMELGLVDKIGHLSPTLKDKFGDNVQINYINPPRRFPLPFDLFSSSALVDAVTHRIQEDLLRSRYGL